MIVVRKRKLRIILKALKKLKMKKVLKDMELSPPLLSWRGNSVRRSDAISSSLQNYSPFTPCVASLVVCYVDGSELE